jgi:hypothetical protein
MIERHWSTTALDIISFLFGEESTWQCVHAWLQYRLMGGRRKGWTNWANESLNGVYWYDVWCVWIGGKGGGVDGVEMNVKQQCQFEKTVPLMKQQCQFGKTVLW